MTETKKEIIPKKYTVLLVWLHGRLLVVNQSPSYETTLNLALPALLAESEHSPTQTADIIARKMLGINAEILKTANTVVLSSGNDDVEHVITTVSCNYAGVEMGDMVMSPSARCWMKPITAWHDARDNLNDNEPLTIAFERILREVVGV